MVITLGIHIYYSFISLSLSVFSSVSTKVAPLNINKVSSSLLSFGRKLIAPMGAGASGVSPLNSEVLSSPSPQPQPPQASAEQPSNTVSSRTQMHVAQQRLLKSESMPVHLSKGENTLLQIIRHTHTHYVHYMAKSVSDHHTIHRRSANLEEVSVPFSISLDLGV